MTFKYTFFDYAERTTRGLATALVTSTNLVIRLNTFCREMKFRFGDRPTIQQYGNRLIEYIDIRFLEYALHRYAALIESGFDPGHAFDVVISGD